MHSVKWKLLTMMSRVLYITNASVDEHLCCDHLSGTIMSNAFLYCVAVSWAKWF